MYVYMTTNVLNGKKYIGRCTKDDPRYLGSGKLLKKAISKYGRKAFSKDIIEHCFSLVQLIERESYWIRFYDAVRSPNFYNMSYKSGGFGQEHRHSQKTREEISLKLKGRKLARSHRENIASASRRRKSWNTGKKFSKGTLDYEKIYARRRPRLLSKDVMIAVLADFDSGNFSFADLSKKYDHRIQMNQIQSYRKKVQIA